MTGMGILTALLLYVYDRIVKPGAVASEACWRSRKFVTSLNEVVS